jgi:serine phosphatase RsbU (regulator of sigma subunit)
MAGGDYYDVFETGDGSLALIVGDASGHGIKACMSIMTMHTQIRMIDWQQYPETGDFVTEVNRRLCSSDIVQDEGGFITLLCSKLDFAAHRLQWTSAGSPMPLLQDLTTNEVTNLRCDEYAGLPLAIEESWRYQQFELELPEHSRLLIYTDGLEEAFPTDDEGDDQFGVEGIISSLKSSADLPLDDALEKLFADSNAYTRGCGRMDDTSVLLVERTG